MAYTDAITVTTPTAPTFDAAAGGVSPTVFERARATGVADNMAMSPDTLDTTTRTSCGGITADPTVVVGVCSATVPVGSFSAFGGPEV